MRVVWICRVSRVYTMNYRIFIVWKCTVTYGFLYSTAVELLHLFWICLNVRNFQKTVCTPNGTPRKRSPGVPRHGARRAFDFAVREKRCNNENTGRTSVARWSRAGRLVTLRAAAAGKRFPLHGGRERVYATAAIRAPCSSFGNAVRLQYDAHASASVLYCTANAVPSVTRWRRAIRPLPLATATAAQPFVPFPKDNRTGSVLYAPRENERIRLFRPRGVDR